MKKAILSAVVMLMASQATFAASGAQCKVDLEQISTQYENGKYLLNQKDGVPEIADCKNVDWAASGTDNKVFITADKSVLIIQNNKDKKLSFSIVPGTITDYAVMAGRLIISTADKKVLVVGRNGNIFEMLTSSGKSYSDIKSIKIVNQILVMDQNNNAPIPLTEDQVTNRINEAGKFRALSF